MVIKGRGAFRPKLPAEMRRIERLMGVLPYKVFENIEHYSGLSDPQLAALMDVRPGRLAEALAQINQGEDKERIAAAVARFNEAMGEGEDADRNTIGTLLRESNRGELLVRIPVYTGPAGELTSNPALVPILEDGTLPAPQFHMNYISSEGAIVIEHRDVTSLATIRRRVNEDVRKDHNGYAPQLPHTLQQNDCIVSMSLHGYLVSAGYRGALYLPGGQQLVPDARLTAHLCLDDLPTEFMRGGHWIGRGGAGRAGQSGRRYGGSWDGTYPRHAGSAACPLPACARTRQRSRWPWRRLQTSPGTTTWRSMPWQCWRTLSPWVRRLRAGRTLSVRFTSSSSSIWNTSAPQPLPPQFGTS